MPEPLGSKNMDEKEHRSGGGESYRLNSSTDETFTSRVGSIFGCLDSLEQKHSEAVKGFEPNDDDMCEDAPCSSTNTNTNNKKDGNMEKPHDDTKYKSNVRKRHNPGYVTEPCKWKKYSLKEDGTKSLLKDLSGDHLNTKVAMDFMNSIKNVEKVETDLSKVDNSFVFKMPDLPSSITTMDKSENKSSFGTSHSAQVRCMETYEFGKNVKSKKHVPTHSELPSSEIVLAYEHPEETQTHHNCADNENVDEDDESCKDNESESKIFISRGKKKKNRVIRKRVCDEEDE